MAAAHRGGSFRVVSAHSHMPAHSEPQPPVVESVLDPVYPYRPRRISPATVLLTGYTPDEFQAEPALFVTRVHPDDFARVVGLYRQVSTDGHAVADRPHLSAPAAGWR